MNPINVLLTCSSHHAVGIIDCLKNNPDNVIVKVYVTNCYASNLPPEELCDGSFVVPRYTDENYIPQLVKICQEQSIDIIIPTSSGELDLMARSKPIFEEIGIKVSVASLEAIEIGNDKSKTYEKFCQYMPKQVVAHNANDVLSFSREVNKMCCKPLDQCGGHGFAIEDACKSTNPSYFHGYGKKHYVSLWQICKAVESVDYPMILQEYVDGMDYAAAAVAVNGKMAHFCGCVATKLEFGATMEGEILIQPIARELTEKVIEELGIDGNVSLDFIVKPDGRVALLEINLRVNASSQFYAKAGCNLVWLRCKQLMGYDISKEKVAIDHGLQMVKYFNAHYFHN
jgi:carbamoyl-phosphate synthase large subunit